MAQRSGRLAAHEHATKAIVWLEFCSRRSRGGIPPSDFIFNGLHLHARIDGRLFRDDANVSCGVHHLGSLSVPVFTAPSHCSHHLDWYLARAHHVQQQVEPAKILVQANTQNGTPQAHLMSLVIDRMVRIHTLRV